MPFIDTHCHLDFEAFDADRDEVMSECGRVGVDRIVIPGATRAHWEKLQKLASRYDGLYFGLGLHPYFLEDVTEKDLQELERRLKERPVGLVAVGETGLDRTRDVDFERQKALFHRHLEFAIESDLPVIVHAVKAHDQIQKAIKDHPGVRGVIHAFAGSPQDAEKYAEKGFRLGIGGVITYERARKTREAVKTVGFENLVLETDAPDMPLKGRQGKRNSPVLIPEVFRALCSLLSEDVKRLETALYENSLRLFGLPK